MEIILTYRGRIPSRAKDKEAVWAMRRSFSQQLEKVWGKGPFTVLKNWEDSNFSAGAPNFIRQIDGHTFVPFYGNKVGIGVSLSIALLTGMPTQKSAISAGDLDNRLKRIVDALRVPNGSGEISANLDPASRWYCLLQDDDIVSSLQANLGPFLESDDPSEAFVLIRVKPVAIRVSLDTLEMLV